MDEASPPERIEFPPVDPLDAAARTEAERRHAQLIKPPGSLGRLEDLGTWLAACQGSVPPRPIARPRVVVFAGDHGIAAREVSIYPPEVTGQLTRTASGGGTAINVLAVAAGAGLRIVDVSVDSDDEVDSRIRRGSGAIDVEDALTAQEAYAAVGAGMRVADIEVDAGADLLITGDLGVANSTPATVLVAALTGTEPVAAIGRGSGIDDNAWMRKAAAIRDALRRARPVLGDPLALLRTAGGADLAATAGFLAQAAVRRTPVLLDGLACGAAAIVAEEFAPGAAAWWVAAHRSDEPAHALALEHLDLDPILDLGIQLGAGVGAATALPLVSASASLLAEMRTYQEAGVSAPVR